MTLLIKNSRIIRNGKFEDVNVLCDAEITKISRQEINAAFDEKIDGHGLVLLPGVIDSHVHFRASGGADSAWDYKEDFASGGAAAAAGGVTTVCDMPNCVPPTTSAAALKAKLTAARHYCCVNYYAHFGVESKDGERVNATEAKKAFADFVGLKVFMGSSTGPLLVQGEALEAAFVLAAKLKKRILVHAELEEFVKRFKEEALKKGVTDHNAVRPPKCAVEATKKALELAEKHKARLHVCHLNCAEEIVLIQEARKKGVAVTSEATPHHLFLNAGEAARIGNNAKVNPPIRSEADRAAIFKAFEAGVIEIAASDHAPHADYEKAQDYWKAPAGFPGVETMLPLLLNAVSERKLSLERVVEATSAAPARINGFEDKGVIGKGKDADFVLVDLKLERKVRGEDLHGKSKWTPFEGRVLRGWPVVAVVCGNVVFERE
ncbi:MAG: dihydroorotase family protein [Candidatus Micrarchaeota archaeon]